MSRTHFQVKVPEELVIHIRAYQSRHDLKTDSAVMLHLISAFFAVGNHAEFDKPTAEPVQVNKLLCRPFQVMEVLRQRGESTAPEIIAALGGEYFDVRTAISDLRRPRNGCVKTMGRKTERGYAYRLTPEGL